MPLELVLVLGLAVQSCATARRPDPGTVRAPRIQQLSQERTASGTTANYAIAPGDQLQISVLNVKELTGPFRVSESGNVTLPLLGSIRLAGLSEREAAAHLRDALAKDYLNDPQVRVSVSEFAGAPVSVVGAVRSPGVYHLHGPNETIADLITDAGGTASDAGTKVYFSPARPGQEQTGEEAARLHLTGTPGIVTGSGDPIVIDLTSMYQGRTIPELSVPVRGGDTILVPTVGNFYVDGWVKTPGSFPVTRTLTFTQAISKAGGLHFAAAPSLITLTRQTVTGDPESYRINYAGIVDGDEPDFYLQSGDKIKVGYNLVRLEAWGIYTFITKIFYFGVGGQAQVTR